MKKSVLAFVALLVLSVSGCADKTPPTPEPAPQTTTREGMNALEDFILGMTREQATDKGAKAYYASPDVMLTTTDWGGQAWNTQLLFQGDSLNILILSTPISAETLNVVLNFSAAHGYMPFSVEQGGREVSIYALAAQGSTPEECDKILEENINDFVKNKNPTCTIMLSGMNLFSKLVAGMQTDTSEEVIFSDAASEPLIAVVLDKQDNMLNMIFSTWGIMTAD